jgi:hypothetical protein
LSRVWNDPLEFEPDWRVTEERMNTFSSTGLMVSVLFMVSMVIVGCAEPDRLPEQDRLDVSWAPGDQWSVATTTWPARRSNPTARADTAVKKTWQFQVLEAEGEPGGLIRVRSEGDRFLMKTDRNASVKALYKIQRTARSGVISTRLLARRTGLGSTGVLFASGDDVEAEGPWYFPDLSDVEFLEDKRYPVLSAQQATGRWIDQRVTPVKGGMKFRLRTRDGTREATLVWEYGDPWWTRATWTNQGRVIGKAHLKSDEAARRARFRGSQPTTDHRQGTSTKGFYLLHSPDQNKFLFGRDKK